MLPFDPSEADIAMVKIERKTHPSPIVRDRLQALYLMSLGYRRQDCASIIDCHINSITNYIKMYNQGGLDLIRQTNYSYERHELKDKFEEVGVALEDNPCFSLEQARQTLKDEFGYERSAEAVRNLLHRLGFRRLKLGTFPGKVKDFDAWLEKQQKFIGRLEALYALAIKGEIDLCFSDAAHFVYGKFAAYGWLRNPSFQPSGHGRHRLNVYGSYDPVSNQVFSMYNEGYVDAEFIVEYLNWLRKECFTDEEIPLHLVLDNARYQHCQLVKETAKKLNVILEFLPGYSPNLNIIERLWRYAKEILGKTFYETKEAFQQAVISIFKNLGNPQHQSALEKLLTMRFQVFEKSQILPC